MDLYYCMVEVEVMRFQIPIHRVRKCIRISSSDSQIGKSIDGLASEISELRKIDNRNIQGMFFGTPDIDIVEKLAHEK